MAVVLRDAYPVAPGHTLVIPLRHVGLCFELHHAEQIAMLSLLDQARAGLEREFTPDAYTTGVNDGVAPGQTVPDIHLNMTLDELRLMPCGEDRSSVAQPRRSVATA